VSLFSQFWVVNKLLFHRKSPGAFFGRLPGKWFSLWPDAYRHRIVSGCTGVKVASPAISFTREKGIRIHMIMFASHICVFFIIRTSFAFDEPIIAWRLPRENYGVFIVCDKGWLSQ
jgi:hypothetical protein